MNLSNQLRIGNIISIIDRSNEIHIPSSFDWVVFSINPFEVELHGINENPAQKANLLVCKTSDILPIELTKDWFDKIEYDKDWDDSGWDGDWLYLYMNGNSIFVKCYKNGRIHIVIENGRDSFTFKNLQETHPYLHQFQNLFQSLTGEELQIKEI